MLVACALVGVGCRSKMGEVVVLNRSESALAQGEVEVCGQRFTLVPLRSGESRRVDFRILQDSEYRITITLASGQHLERSLGYVTAGLEYHDTLTIQNDDITLEAGDSAGGLRPPS